MKNIEELNLIPLGTLLWKMHNSRSMACLSSKNKHLVLLLSSHATSIDVLGAPYNTVLCQNDAICEQVPTFSIHEGH